MVSRKGRHLDGYACICMPKTSPQPCCVRRHMTDTIPAMADSATLRPFSTREPRGGARERLNVRKIKDLLRLHLPAWARRLSPCGTLGHTRTCAIEKTTGCITRGLVLADRRRLSPGHIYCYVASQHDSPIPAGSDETVIVAIDPKPSFVARRAFAATQGTDMACLAIEKASC